MTSFNPKIITHKTPSSWLAIVLALWLSGVYGILIMNSIKSRDESEGVLYLILLVAAIIWPLLYFAGSRCTFKPNKIRTGTLFALCVFFLFSILSSFASPIPFKSLAFIMLTIVGVVISLQFLSNMETLQLERGFKLYSFLVGLILLGFVAYDYVPGVRLGEGKGVLNPNSIAMVAFSGSLASMAFRSLIFRVSMFSVFFIIIYLTGSRASALGAIIGLGIIIFIRLKDTRVGTKAMFLIAVLFVAILGFLYWDKFSPFVDEFLSLNTRDRGISSGASGRIFAWLDTLRLFEENPIVGVGFRAHEQLLTVGSSSHNGYLAMLAEIGLFGFAAVMYLVFSGVYLLWKQTKSIEYKYTHSILLGILMGYMFLAVFERFLINVGNPTSLLFLIGILAPTLRHIEPKSKRLRTLENPYKPDTFNSLTINKPL